MVGESNDTVKGLQDLARDTTTYRPVLLVDSLASSHTDSLLTAPVDTARLRAVTDSVSKLAAVPPIRPLHVLRGDVGKNCDKLVAAVTAHKIVNGDSFPEQMREAPDHLITGLMA